MGLKDNLPQFVAEEKYTKEVLEAIEPEIDKIKMKLNAIMLECCINTCGIDGIKRFEKDYDITYNAVLTIEERRRQVINKMLSKKRLTKAGLADFIKRNINNSQYYISNMAEDYAFKVRIVEEKYTEELFNALFKARPANLVFNIEIVNYKQRCKTFNCGEKVF